VPKQQSEDFERALKQLTGSTSGVLQLLTIGNVVFALAMQGSLQNLWGSIGTLQLIVHLPLNEVSYPPHVQTMFEQLIGVVQFDLLELTDAFDIEVGPSFTETEPYSAKFDYLGYNSKNTYENLGFTNFILAVLLFENLVFVLSSIGVFSKCPRIHARFKIDGETQSAANI